MLSLSNDIFAALLKNLYKKEELDKALSQTKSFTSSTPEQEQKRLFTISILEKAIT